MSTPLVTTFAETATLYAVLTNDDQEAERILTDMLPAERAEFARQLDRLCRLMTDRFGNDRPILTQRIR